METPKKSSALKCRKVDQAANSEGTNWQSHSARLNELPLEIIHEIIHELDPVDLLHLSWTCKLWYATLMDKSVRRIWETVCKGSHFFSPFLTTCTSQAFKRLEVLPDNSPPPYTYDVSLLQFVRFVFIRKCTVRK